MATTNNVLNNEENIIPSNAAMEIEDLTKNNINSGDVIDLTNKTPPNATMTTTTTTIIGEELKSEDMSGVSMVLDTSASEDVEDREMTIPFSFIRRYDIATQSHYYEDSETKGTTWDLPEDRCDWVDLTQLLVMRNKATVFKTVDEVTNSFARADVTISSAKKHLNDKFLLSFASEEDAWSALFFLDIEYSTPEKAYSNSNKWFNTKYEFLVRFFTEGDFTGMLFFFYQFFFVFLFTMILSMGKAIHEINKI